MCLLKVDKIYKGTSKAIRIGYKVFENYNGELTSFIAPAKKTLPTWVWIDEKDYRLKKHTGILYTGEDYYPAGWHVYVELDDAKLFALLRYRDKYEVIHQVQCQGLLVEGMDALDREVRVYRYIKISKEVWHA